MFCAGRCTDLKIIQGTLGLAEPWTVNIQEDDPDNDDKKSMRLAKAIDKQVNAFF